MFKSIQYKIVSVFVLLTLSLITIVGSFMVVNIVNFYNEEFFVMMDKVFNEKFVYDLNQLAKSEEPLKSVESAVSSYIGPLGIDTYRFYSILDAKTGNVLLSSDPSKVSGINKTDNIIMAMSGKTGNIINNDKNYMDYAVPVNLDGNNRYIVYIKDTKEELNSITNNVLVIVIESLLLAILVSVIIGYLLGKTISVPIINLTKRAERLAAGEFDVMEISKENDEIGRLSNSFGYMSEELKKTIIEVNEEKTKIETILLNMTDGILAFDLSGKLILSNPEAQKFMSGEDFDTITFDEFFKKIEANITLGDLIYIKNEASPERLVNYNDRYLKLNYATIETDNKISGVLVVMHDITNQEKLELSRREFVSNVSHELRTPLTTVKSYAETLMDESMNDKDLQSRFLSVIIKEADRMTRIVKDLLTLSKLDEAQNEVIEPDDINLQVLLDGVIEKMYITAKKKNQEITYKPINEVPVFKSNRDKLEQVIINIVSNAIKYTSDGGKIDLVSGKLYNDAFVKVIDNGIGIPKENIPRLFERFYRIDKARSRDTGGTGLGLAISKQIIENIGGTITINSEFGKGTEVIITFPIL
ncbi:MAG: HAMP domain-containing protein [Clostridia bacterium]|nr:HAMP domain-containing protein [Clostridia bacterium]